MYNLIKYNTLTEALAFNLTEEQLKLYYWLPEYSYKNYNAISKKLMNQYEPYPKETSNSEEYQRQFLYEVREGILPLEVEIDKIKYKFPYSNEYLNYIKTIQNTLFCYKSNISSVLYEIVILQNENKQYTLGEITSNFISNLNNNLISGRIIPTRISVEIVNPTTSKTAYSYVNSPNLATNINDFITDIDITFPNGKSNKEIIDSIYNPNIHIYNSMLIGDKDGGIKYTPFKDFRWFENKKLWTLDEILLKDFYSMSNLIPEGSIILICNTQEIKDKLQLELDTIYEQVSTPEKYFELLNKLSGNSFYKEVYSDDNQSELDSEFNGFFIEKRLRNCQLKNIVQLGYRNRDILYIFSPVVGLNTIFYSDTEEDYPLDESGYIAWDKIDYRKKYTKGLGAAKISPNIMYKLRSITEYLRLKQFTNRPEDDKTQGIPYDVTISQTLFKTDYNNATLTVTLGYTKFNETIYNDELISIYSLNEYVGIVKQSEGVYKVSFKSTTTIQEDRLVVKIKNTFTGIVSSITFDLDCVIGAMTTKIRVYEDYYSKFIKDCETITGYIHYEQTTEMSNTQLSNINQANINNSITYINDNFMTCNIPTWTPLEWQSSKGFNKSIKITFLGKRLRAEDYYKDKVGKYIHTFQSKADSSVNKTITVELNLSPVNREDNPRRDNEKDPSKPNPSYPVIIIGKPHDKDDRPGKGNDDGPGTGTGTGSNNNSATTIKQPTIIKQYTKPSSCPVDRRAVIPTPIEIYPIQTTSFKDTFNVTNQTIEPCFNDAHINTIDEENPYGVNIGYLTDFTLDKPFRKESNRSKVIFNASFNDILQKNVSASYWPQTGRDAYIDISKGKSENVIVPYIAEYVYEYDSFKNLDDSYMCKDLTNSQYRVIFNKPHFKHIYSKTIDGELLQGFDFKDFIRDSKGNYNAEQFSLYYKLQFKFQQLEYNNLSKIPNFIAKTAIYEQSIDRWRTINNDIQLIEGGVSCPTANFMATPRQIPLFNELDNSVNFNTKYPTTVNQVVNMNVPTYSIADYNCKLIMLPILKKPSSNIDDFTFAHLPNKVQGFFSVSEYNKDTQTYGDSYILYMYIDKIYYFPKEENCYIFWVKTSPKNLYSDLYNSLVAANLNVQYVTYVDGKPVYTTKPLTEFLRSLDDCINRLGTSLATISYGSVESGGKYNTTTKAVEYTAGAILIIANGKVSFGGYDFLLQGDYENLSGFIGGNVVNATIYPRYIKDNPIDENGNITNKNDINKLITMNIDRKE